MTTAQLTSEIYNEIALLGEDESKLERLTGNLAGKWSRRITRKHRLIYEIIDDRVVVIVITAYGHYDDK